MFVKKIDVKDMFDRMHLDEKHAMSVSQGSKNWHIVVGDEILAIDPLISAKMYHVKDKLSDGSNRLTYTHNGATIQIYIWIEKSKQYVAVGTRKDVVGEIGEEETAKLDALYEGKT